MSPKKLRDKVIESLEELKAVDQVCLDVSSLTTLTDFMIIVTGTSSRHIQSLADRVVEDLKNLNIRIIIFPHNWRFYNLSFGRFD